MISGTILVTGGAGFIGCNLVRRLLASTQASVVVLDKLTYAGNRESLSDVSDHPRFRFVRGDIAERATVEDLFREHHPDAVMNLAAESHVDRSIDTPRPFIHTNVQGTFELLEAARRYLAEGDPIARERFRFLHVSTDEVYGSLGPKGYFHEESPYSPNSPYAASKASADHLVRAYHTTYGLPGIVTNCSNNYGPFQYPEKLIPLTILNALEGRPLPIYGDGGNVRDWLYVEDHCEGLMMALERGAPGERYNFGGGGEKTNVEVVDRICDVLDAIAPPSRDGALAARDLRSYKELKSFVPDRPGHDRRYAIDPSKAKQSLSWKPTRSFDAGIAETVRWYVGRRDWCDAVLEGRYGRERLGLPPAVKT